MKSSVKLSMIAARSSNGVIGREGELPWRLADDLAIFKQVTSDHPVLMGRKTWESLPVRPLPKRDNIVLSRDWAYEAEGARVFSALRPAIEAGRALARSAGKQEAFILGGQSLYEAAIASADLLYLSEVEVELDGDARFPDFDPADFEQISSKHVAADARNEYAFTFRVLKRRR